MEYCTRGGILERSYVQGAVFGGLGFVRWGLRRVVGLDCFVQWQFSLIRGRREGELSWNCTCMI